MFNHRCRIDIKTTWIIIELNKIKIVWDKANYGKIRTGTWKMENKLFLPWYDGSFPLISSNPLKFDIPYIFMRFLVFQADFSTLEQKKIHSILLKSPCNYSRPNKSTGKTKYYKYKTTTRMWLNMSISMQILHWLRIFSKKNYISLSWQAKKSCALMFYTNFRP